MHKLKLGDGNPFTIPETIEEITFYQYLQLNKRIIEYHDNPEYEAIFYYLSPFVKLEPSELFALPANTFNNICSFFTIDDDVIKVVSQSKVKGNTVTLSGVEHNYPKNFNKVSIGQKLYLDSVIQKAQMQGKYEYDVYADFVAVLMMPYIMDEYRDDWVEEMKAVMMRESANTIVGLGSFFLTNYANSMRTGMLVYTVQEIQKRLNQGLRTWTITGAFRFCIKLLKVILLNSKKSQKSAL